MKFLTTEEVAVVLRETPATTSRRCKRGEIEASDRSGRWLISEQALANYLAPTNTDLKPELEPEPKPEPVVYLTASQKRAARRRVS